MTWEEAKDQIAREHGLGKTLVTGHLSKYWEEAARLYARSKWDEACNAQKELCEVAIWPACVEGSHHVEILSKSEEAIKKCLKPEFNP